MDYLQGTNKVFTCVGMDDKLKKHNLEAEKRLKKVEQDYLHTNQKYMETRSQWESLNDEKRRAINLCSSVSLFVSSCNQLVEKLQKALNKIPTTETTDKTIDHRAHHEAIREFRVINHELYYIQRKMPRRDSRKAVNNLLKEVKKKNKCKDKALSNCTLVCKPTCHDTLRKSVELEIKALKKLIRELQRDWEEKLHIRQYATNIHKDFRQKVKHLEEKKEHLSGKWDEERKKHARCEDKT